MGAASNLVGMQLVGDRAKRKWNVLEQIKFEPGLSKGHFSVGYKVVDEKGVEAFLKASDLSLALEKDDPVQALLEVTTAHQFERSILEHCVGNRLDKVVTAIDSGTSQIIFDGVRDAVFFIVFELAEGDLRKFVEVERGNDLAWVVSALHSFAVAVSQIHGVNVFHNDLKPANALIFEEDHKVADFGRATSPDFPVAHDKLLCAGDRRFAPPEQLYHNENDATALPTFLKARAGDLYNLGSIMHFLVTKRMLTPEIISRLDDPFKPFNPTGGWNDSYEGVLPYWRRIFDAIMTEFYDDLPETWSSTYKFALDEIKDIIMHICEPDFRMRGDLIESSVQPSKYGLSRVVSRLDNLRSRVLVKSRAQ
jgi:eukaryotic-like serine/threonine-protein kinase